LSRKVDLLEGKKAGVITRSWNHYGAILSGSQLMLFKDDDWFDSKIADLKDSSVWLSWITFFFFFLEKTIIN
jgi:hypothetical protein